MRVIAGSAKGKPLKGPRAAKGHIRPTSDKVREALFDMLQGELEGASVLDLYAGTGALAIEALSRGAEHADLVEADREAQSIIRDNLARTGVAERAKVLAKRVEPAVAQLERRYDLILADPPYADAAITSLLPDLARALEPEGVLVVEHASRATMPDETPNLQLWKRRRHGDTTLSMYRRSVQ